MQKLTICGFLLFFLMTLSGCGCNTNSSKKLSYVKLSNEDEGNTKYHGHYKVGDKYTIKNRSYTPKEFSYYNKVGIASWYGKRYGFHKNKTANGDFYNKDMLTAAHKTLQLPCLVEVTNLANKKSVIVMVNDRGPFAKNRIIDMSERAAEILGFKDNGIAKVRVKYLPNESKKLLKILGLKAEKNSISKKHLHNPKCSVNCYIKLFNHKKLKNNLV